MGENRTCLVIFNKGEVMPILWACQDFSELGTVQGVSNFLIEGKESHKS